MNNDAELRATVRSIIDANRYLTLGTIGDDGRPWTSPVYYASADCVDFYWISAPEAAHSRNLAQRPAVSVVIFNSQVPPGQGLARAVYLTGEAVEVTGPDFEAGLEIYPGPPERGVRDIPAEELSPPGPFRLYRARAAEHWILCPRDAGQPCARHGTAYDHRVAVPF